MIMSRSLLLCAALAPLAACAPRTTPSLSVAPDSAAYAASVAQAERKARKLKIHESYDRITGLTTVSLPLLSDGALSTSGVRVVASFAYAGDSGLVEPPAEVLLMVDWEDYGGSTELLQAPSAHFLVDDSARFAAPGRDHERYVNRSLLQVVFADSTFRQRVTLAIPREDFARLTAARKVEGRLTNGREIRMGLEHIVALRRLEARMEGR
jgi:hypothetical protein